MKKKPKRGQVELGTQSTTTRRTSATWSDEWWWSGQRGSWYGSTWSWRSSPWAWNATWDKDTNKKIQPPDILPDFQEEQDEAADWDVGLLAQEGMIALMSEAETEGSHRAWTKDLEGSPGPPT